MSEISEKTKKRNTKYRKALDLKDKECRLCGRKATQRHHVFELNDHPWMATVPENLDPLCNMCHSRLHQDCTEEEYRNLLRADEPERMRVLDKLAGEGGKVNALKELLK